MKFHVKALAVSLGLANAIFMLSYALLGFFWGWGLEGLQLIASFYPGFGPSLIGGMIGAFWGFIEGALFGWLLGYLYNRCVDKCKK